MSKIFTRFLGAFVQAYLRTVSFPLGQEAPEQAASLSLPEAVGNLRQVVGPMILVQRHKILHEKCLRLRVSVHLSQNPKRLFLQTAVSV